MAETKPGVPEAALPPLRGLRQPRDVTINAEPHAFVSAERIESTGLRDTPPPTASERETRSEFVARLLREVEGRSRA